VDEDEDQRAYRGCPAVQEVLLSCGRGQAVAGILPLAGTIVRAPGGS